MNILFPIETISRELDYKLVLAHKLAGTNNRKIHFGGFQFLDKCLRYFTGGLYVGKNIFRNDARKFKPKGYFEQKKHGIDTIYYYEEGGFYYNNDDMWKNSLEFSCNPRVFDEHDYVFVWGEKQKAVLAEMSKFPQNIKNVGVIRFDLYKDFFYLYQDKHTQEKSKYILINTHNGFSNNYNDFDKFTNFYKYPKMTVEDRIQFLSKYNYDSNNLFDMVHLVLSLAKRMPEKKFVIRPHPSEDINYYHIIFEGIENVKIVRKGSVGSWLANAEALIHAGCTTSFEAHFTGVPVITYIKQINSYSIYPANSIGYITNNVDDAFQILSIVNSGKDPREAGFVYQLNGSEVINNLNKPALDLFMEEYQKIETNYLRKQTDFKSPSAWQVAWRAVRTGLFQTLYYYGNVILGRSDKLTAYQYNKNKNPGFDKDYIQNVLNRLERETGKKVKFKFYNANYFIIE